MFRTSVWNIFWCSLCFTLAESVTDFGKCKSPNNDPGLCVRLSDCEFIRNMTLSLGTTADAKDKEFLQKSQCGHDNEQTDLVKKILVCCPNRYLNVGDGIVPGNVLPQPGSCGTFIEDKILNGIMTALDEFPWMALLEYDKPDGTSDHRCGGSLINSRYVLTAAHCIKGSQVPANWNITHVRLGEWDRGSNPDCTVDKFGNKRDCAPPHLDIKVESTIVHELYNPNSQHQLYDIALIRLAEYVTYNMFVKPICLPLAQDLRNEQFAGRTLVVAGWGQTLNETYSPIKLKANVIAWPINECQIKYERLSYVLNETQLCAGGEKLVDTCNGDSGGPLMVKELLGQRNIHFVAGIVSYGPNPCGVKNWPGVYTKVGQFVDWIQDKLRP